MSWDKLNNYTLPKDFVKVPLVLIGLNVQLWFAGLEVSRLRKKVFNKKWL